MNINVPRKQDLMSSSRQVATVIDLNKCASSEKFVGDFWYR
jgi:hypothetical protein